LARGWAWGLKDERKMGTGFAVPIGRSRIGTPLEDVAEGPEEEAGEHHGDGEGQDPGHQQVAHGGPLQAGVIRQHGAGDTGR
jgi:hypothetical protein